MGNRHQGRSLKRPPPRNAVNFLKTAQNVISREARQSPPSPPSSDLAQLAAG